MIKRVIVGVTLAAATCGIMAIGGIVAIIFFALLSGIAVYETAHITPGQGFRPHTFPAYVCAVCFPFVGYFFGDGKMIAFFFFMMALSMAGIVVRRPEEPENAVISMLFYSYPLALLLCVVRIFLIPDKPLAYTLFFVTIAAPALTDVFALLGGVRFGKHKLCPHISPKKTVEGAVSGLIAGPITALLAYYGQRIWQGQTGFAALLGIAFCCSAFGQFGDLFASLLKRWAGVKDYSNLLPGHGGVMDRMDSIIICAPLVYAIYQFLWA